MPAPKNFKTRIEPEHVETLEPMPPEYLEAHKASVREQILRQWPLLETEDVKSQERR